MGRRRVSESRAGIELTNLDEPLFDGSEVTKRDLVDYLDAVGARLLPELRDRPLSVVRVRPGQPPFMQKNLPSYAPDWIPRVPVWSATSHRTIDYPLCHDRATLLWLANQRAVEFHPTMVRRAGAGGTAGEVTHLVLDLDPPEDAGFTQVVAAARAVRQALDGCGLAGAVKTSGAKGLHVVVPVVVGTTIEDAAAATRALAARAERVDPVRTTTAYLRADRGGRVFLDPTRAGGASLAAAYSPRARPGVPVSWPVAWEDLDDVDPAAFTVRTMLASLGADGPDHDAWRAALPAPQALPADLVEEGRAIPVPRVTAMHEGKRRAAARRRLEP